MKTSCIQHPAEEYYSIRHEWQVEFCDGNHCAAELLSYFEYRHNGKLIEAEKNTVANQIAAQHGDVGAHDATLYQFHSQEELKRAIHGAFSIDSIREATALLEAKGAITKHRNPNPHYKFDRTTYYLFHPDVCNRFIDSRKICNREQENPSPSPKNRPPSPKNRQTITIQSSIQSSMKKREESKDSSPIRLSSKFLDRISHERPPTEDISSEIIPHDEPELEPKKRLSQNDYSGGFLRFCKLHPWGGVSRSKAWGIWRRLKLDDHAEEICTLLEKQVKWPSMAKEGFRYFPRMPAYLNGKRWLDDEPHQVASRPQQRKSAYQIYREMIDEREGRDGDSEGNSGAVDITDYQFPRVEEESNRRRKPYGDDDV